MEPRRNANRPQSGGVILTETGHSSLRFSTYPGPPAAFSPVLPPLGSHGAQEIQQVLEVNLLVVPHA
jgi:hypothetical protein